MAIETVLLANSSFLLIVLLIIITLAFRNEPPSKRRFKVRDDIKRIKEQIEK